MIRDSRTWIDITATDHNARRPKIAGKWLCFGPTREMHLYRDLLNTLVEDGTFAAAKIARKDPVTDPFPHKDCVVCVFTSADREDIARVADKLKQVGLNPSSWKSDQETRTDWSDQGKLALEAAVVQGKKGLADSNAVVGDCSPPPSPAVGPAEARPPEAATPPTSTKERLATTKLVIEIVVGVLAIIGGIIALFARSK